MKVSFNEINNIIKTLPIGYYIGRKLDLTLSETEKGSYYDPMHDKIVISYPMIDGVLDKLIDDKDIEETVRTLTYHETSHALLTPRELKMNDIINIFEDERIETLLRKFYMNTNFKKFLQRVSGFKGEAPTSTLDAFYQLVRFRVGEPEFLERVKELINKYKDLSQMNTYPSTSTNYWRYEDDIRSLWNDFSTAYEMKKFEEMKKQKEMKKETDEKPDSSSISTLSEQVDKEDDKEVPNMDNIEIPECDETDSEYDEKFAKQLVTKTLDHFVDADLNESVNTILSRISKATSRNGSAINSYSGVFDPRSVIRDDYKYFAQQNRNGHVRAYAKTHLTLVIDRSGSFHSSEKIVNKLLYAIHQFEKQNSDFSFDLITCGMSEQLEDKNNRQLKTSGGNLLDKKIFELMKSCQKPGTSNYNIVLFDGDAFSDASRYSAKDYYENFKAFDMPNLTIISDRSNEKHIKRYCKRAKQVISSNYTEELISHTLLALQMLTR